MTAWTFAATRWSFAGFLLLTLVCHGSVEADETATESRAESQAFELRVVDLEGNVVPNASIEIRCRPRIAATDIVVGTSEKKGTYGVMVKADSIGVLRLQRKQFPKNISFSIVSEGYAPYWLAFDTNKNSMPDSATARIEAAWAVGGVVLDPGGRPIEGAEVHPSLPFRMPPTATRSLHVGTTIKTDAKGRWRYGHVPISKRDVAVAINHPKFGPVRTNLSRSEFESTAEQPSSGSVTLTQGLTLAGFVRDLQGKPIEDATVRTKFLNEIRETKTDDFGRYQLTGCEEMHCRVVVIAKERALEMKEVHIRPGMEPVDFVLPPGGHVKVRVVDADGNGLPKTRIFLQRCRLPSDVQSIR
ncbi:carboxypeptidase regulatory-like domain-containing protein [Rhodopirellula sp. P2]|uniref:carboxypeptidase regulatory-like domain-containing protein n=1 Tax=Rhodopirellula sp. P2 TaxID=2127060 RepID=UPI002368C77E|nr:carboxypeptidase regulatory-like domain-containing protein [Rhodopirellula sp. P2]WDQ15359.1 carboxypeptidase regulatory-like domain-containing protein [Rhodopirellula sp. P2]